MTLARALGWVLFTVWAVWAFALQGAVGTPGSLGVGSRWMPDIGLVLALSLLARLEAQDALLCALLATLARSVTSVEPAIVQLAGCLGIVALALAVRSVVELTSPLWRAVVAAVLVFAFDAWLIATHGVRGGQSMHAQGFDALALLSPWRSALSSGLLALAAGPLLAGLPGLSPLRSRRW